MCELFFVIYGEIVYQFNIDKIKIMHIFFYIFLVGIYVDILIYLFKLFQGCFINLHGYVNL